MRQQKGNVSAVIIVLVLLFGGIFVALRSQKGITNEADLPVIKVLSTTQESEVRSLDGTFKLVMNAERQIDGSNTYTFLISDPKAPQALKTFFTKTLAAAASMILPPNSWSPDDKDVFIKENGPDGVHFLVFKASGEPFASGEQYVDVSPLFVKSQPNLRLKEVTGWDGPDTLHVTSLTDQGTGGPSFWFIVSTRAFLQLAS